jgi:hypothetical protein
MGASMSAPLSAPEILNREFLEVRCKVLELAAAFDRLARAEGSVADDPRSVRLREAIHAVLDLDEDRAERVQMIFSRAYDEKWQSNLKVLPR